MSEQKYLYHCDQCGEVFKTKIKAKSELVCTQCGEPPVRSGFTTVAQVPTLDSSTIDEIHGVAGQDEADFFSIQRKKKQQRAINIYISWIAIILLALGVSLLVKRHNDNKEAEKAALNKEAVLLAKRQTAAEKICIQRFIAFTKSEDANKRSVHIVDGTDQLVDMMRFYSNPVNITDYEDKEIIISKSEYIKGESGKPNRLNVTMKMFFKDIAPQVFEAVFWEVKNTWLLDWGQFSRVSAIDWDRFNRTQAPGKYAFSLYARKRKIELNTGLKYNEFVFSKPINNQNDITSDPNPVLVLANSDLEAQLNAHIGNIHKKRGEKQVLGLMDIPGQARVRVVIEFEEIDGKKHPILKELIKTDWATPPKK